MDMWIWQCCVNVSFNNLRVFFKPKNLGDSVTRWLRIKGSEMFRMKIHDVFQLSRIKLRKMMDSFYVKIWDRKREQRQALGSNDSSILLAHNAWTAALYMFTLHICSLHQLSSSCVLICWSGTLKISVSWLEISIWSGQSLLMKVRHCWILLFPWPRT